MAPKVNIAAQEGRKKLGGKLGMAALMKRAGTVEDIDVEQLDRDSMHVVFAYDGSYSANHCRGLCMDYIMPKRTKCRVNVLHFFNAAEQASLPYKKRRSTIEAELSGYDIAYGKRFKLNLLRAQDGVKIGQQIVEYTNQISEKEPVHFLVMGFRGWNDKIADIVNSQVGYAMGHSNCSTIMIQDTFEVYTGCNILVPMDMNPWSEKALVDALMLSEEGDAITVLHICSDADGMTKQQSEHFDKLIKITKRKFGGKPRKLSFIVQKSGGGGAAQDILDYCESHPEIQMICMGTDAVAKKMDPNRAYLGSVASRVLVDTSMPVCIAHYDPDLWTSVTEAEKKASKDKE